MSQFHLHFLVQTPLEDDASTQLYGVFSIAESPEATQLYEHGDNDDVSTFLEESGDEKNNDLGNEEPDKELMEFELGSSQYRKSWELVFWPCEMHWIPIFNCNPTCILAFQGVICKMCLFHRSLFYLNLR